MTAATHTSALAAGPPGSTRLAHSDASAFFPNSRALSFYDGPIGSWGPTVAKGFEVAVTIPPGPFAARRLSLAPVVAVAPS